jgi:hypothetical protein
MNNNNTNVNYMNYKRNANQTPKRSLSELGLEDTTSQESKRVADPSTMPNDDKNKPFIQPAINEVFTPVRSLIRSPVLNKENPLYSTQQTFNLDDNQVPHAEDETMDNTFVSQSSNIILQNHYTIPTNNSFDALSNINNNVNNNTRSTDPLSSATPMNEPIMQTSQKTIKIPPITVISATNFASTIKILGDTAPNVNYTIKYMSIGTKIQLNNIDVYKKLLSALNTANIEFFTHDLNPDRFDKYILSGIPKFPIQEIIDSLKEYQIEPLEIREISQKNKRFDEEGSYVVTFKHGATKIINLAKTKINHTVPKWRIFQKSSNNITQCRRCQLLGHGMRNCYLQPKCAKCGMDHMTDVCTSPIEKCANCKGDHPSTSVECPKRKDFIKMRAKLASSNNTKPAKPTPAPRKSLENFPFMAKSASSKNSTAISASDKPHPFNWSALFNNSPASSSQQSNTKAQEKFKIEEIGPIMIEIFTGLKKCQSKEQQLVLMFEIATKYIYNVGP